MVEGHVTVMRAGIMFGLAVSVKPPTVVLSKKQRSSYRTNQPNLSQMFVS